LSLLSARGLPQQAYPLLFPYFALVNPLAEEYFWRGGVYATLRHLFQSWVWPALVSSVLFGAWHWLVIRLFVTPPIALCATFVIMGIGFALCVVYERTRRLGYAVALHAFAGDAPLLLLLLLVGRG
jgi:membrane protease YdiL (CAAX protease family)